MTRFIFPYFTLLSDVANGKYLNEVVREVVRDGDWAWDDFDDRRHLVAVNLECVQAVKLGLAYVVNELENRDHAVLDVWLTETGQVAFTAQKKGFVWELSTASINMTQTERFWRERIDRIPHLDSNSREEVMSFLKNIPDPALDHLVPYAAMKMMEAE